jgi:hypothetical protein
MRLRQEALAALRTKQEKMDLSNKQSERFGPDTRNIFFFVITAILWFALAGQITEFVRLSFC